MRKTRTPGTDVDEPSGALHSCTRTSSGRGPAGAGVWFVTRYVEGKLSNKPLAMTVG